jgi:hypothetical protein
MGATKGDSMTNREMAAGAALTLVLVVILGGTPSQGRVQVLPQDCRDGEVVVSRGHGEFECKELTELLGTRPCSSGDVVIVDSFHALACVQPNKLDLGARDALPSCSSGEILVSEGFGRWTCAAR